MLHKRTRQVVPVGVQSNLIVRRSYADRYHPAHMFIKGGLEVAVVKTAERTALRSAATAAFFMKGAPKVLEHAPEVLELFVVLARTGERRDLTGRWEFLLQTCVNAHKHFTGLRVDYQPDLARN